MKVLGIVLIVINHVVQTLEGGNEYISYSDYVVNLNFVTTDLQTFVLIILRYSGALGNNIFFICSAWFLLESQEVNRKKLLTMIVETWSVSIIMLVSISLLRGGGKSKIAYKIIISLHFCNKLVYSLLCTFLCASSDVKSLYYVVKSGTAVKNCHYFRYFVLWM